MKLAMARFILRLVLLDFDILSVCYCHWANRLGTPQLRPGPGPSYTRYRINCP